MSGAQDISLLKLSLLILILIIPAVLTFIVYKKGTTQIFTAILRMVIQLSVVGFFLQFVFEKNFVLINIIWIIIMILIADINVYSKVKSGHKIMLFWGFIALLLPVVIVNVFLMLLVINPVPVYDARHLITITGMLLGNSMNGVILAYDRFYNELNKNSTEYYGYLSLGATKNEAVRPFVSNAYRSAVLPTISSIATMGLVSLPGMMTGQILGGSAPVIAIKYQIMIMIAILFTVSFSSFLIIQFLKRILFDKYGIIKNIKLL